MIRKLTTALLVVAGAMAVMASTAQAANFTSAAYPATVSGAQVGTENYFLTSKGEVECDNNETAYWGFITGPSETLTIQPEFKECMFGGIPTATVNTTGCDLLFHLTGATSASFDIVCETGRRIDVTMSWAPGCTLTLLPTLDRELGEFSRTRAAYTGVTLTNISGGDIEAEIRSKGIHYEFQDCWMKGSETRTDGEYVSVVILEGWGTNIDVG